MSNSAHYLIHLTLHEIALMPVEVMTRLAFQEAGTMLQGDPDTLSRDIDALLHTARTHPQLATLLDEACAAFLADLQGEVAAMRTQHTAAEAAIAAMQAQQAATEAAIQAQQADYASRLAAAQAHRPEAESVVAVMLDIKGNLTKEAHFSGADARPQVTATGAPVLTAMARVRGDAHGAMTFERATFSPTVQQQSGAPVTTVMAQVGGDATGTFDFSGAAFHPTVQATGAPAETATHKPS